MAGENRNIYGGAMSLWLPPSIVDISDLRQVPDNQEVFGHTCTDQSLVVEILEYVNQTDQEAVRTHFDDIAQSNEAAGELSEVLSVEPLSSVSLTQCDSAWLLNGHQMVGKFKENAKNEVNIYMGLFRLSQFSTDILVTLNDPVKVSPESSSHTSLPTSSERWSKEQFYRTITSLKLIDTGLFGS